MTNTAGIRSMMMQICITGKAALESHFVCAIGKIRILAHGYTLKRLIKTTNSIKQLLFEGEITACDVIGFSISYTKITPGKVPGKTQPDGFFVCFAAFFDNTTLDKVTLTIERFLVADKKIIVKRGVVINKYYNLSRCCPCADVPGHGY